MQKICRVCPGGGHCCCLFVHVAHWANVFVGVKCWQAIRALLGCCWGWPWAMLARVRVESLILEFEHDYDY